MLGIPYRRKLRPYQRDKAREVEQLLVAMRIELGMSDWDVLRAVGIKPPFCRYLNRLYCMPKRVLVFCREALAPDSGFRKRAAGK